SATRGPRCAVVPSTTTIRLTPPPLASRVGSTKTPPKNSGPSSTITQNHFCRTRSTNSRRTTARILRMGHLRARRRRSGVRPDQIDEDLVEGRLRQLEPRQPRPRAHQRLEDLLSVALPG